MRKYIATIIALVTIDQLTKYLINGKFMGACVNLVPKVLIFRPVQNTNLSWFASMIGYKTPIYQMVLVQLTCMLILILLYRYLSYITSYLKMWRLNSIIYLIFTLSGIYCSFIDAVFWGGSIDYIQLFDWFTFDLKDVYLTTVSSIALIPIFISYIIRYYKESKVERKKQSVLFWIKAKCPLDYIDN